MTLKTKRIPGRGHTLKKIGIGVLAVVIIFAVAAGFIIRSIFTSGKPVLEGTVTVNGLSAPVTITRDENGVPHIKGQTTQDVYFAQGYAHAQDRMFNMDLSRRTGYGRLCEVFGQMAVSQDQYYLTLGLDRAAALSLAAYPAETIALLDGYTAGINAYIDEKSSDGKWPTEFKLLGYQPERWSTVDTLLLGKLMAHDMAGHWKAQVSRMYLLAEYGLEEALELFPSVPEQAPTHITDADLALSLLSADIPVVNESNGSNNWVVSGQKTESGMPLLANDPHLSIATPSIWYVNHLISPDMEVSGTTFAGVPGIILGQNQYGAWGVTNTGPDVQDVYIEKIHPDNPYRYLYQDEWLEMEVFSYTMKVKGGDEILYEVRQTMHGPIISDLADNVGVEQDTAFALRWTALDATLELEALIGYNRAKNWTEFEKCLEGFHAPAMNFVYANLDGTIAYKPNGLIPIRAGNNDALLPMEGWTGENEWIGYIPFDELPKVVNPVDGFVATANYKIVGDDYPYHLSNNWAQPYRQMRIVEVLSSKDTFTAEDMRLLQDDTKNLRAEAFGAYLADIFAGLESQPSGKQAAETLQAWRARGYLDEPEEAGALLFSLVMDEIPNVLFEEIPSEVYKLMRGTGNVVDNMLTACIAGGEPLWVQKNGGIAAVLSKALDRAIARVSPQQGSDISKWQYGKFHQVMFSHPLSSQSYLKPFFNPRGRLASAGSDVTVRAATNNQSGLNNHGASWRFVADLNDMTKTWQIVAPGISGHPASPYYQDQINRWLEGELYLVDQVAYSGKTLTLVPR